MIYIAITFAWGTDFVASDGIKKGFSVDKSFQKYGFKDGDKIISVNGKPFENVLEINKYLFLREVSSIDVAHADGTKEQIKLPEDIGKVMWQNGVMQPFQVRFPSVLDSVFKGAPAEMAGLQKGDIIIAVNEEKTPYQHQFIEKIKNSKGTLSVRLQRNGEEKVVEITPKEGKVGIAFLTKDFVNIQHKEYSLGESMVKGSELAYRTLTDYISQFKYVFTKKGATSLGGFISIGKIFPSQWNWQSFWSITAFLSIMLGFMNLLPIPALDGGHVMFTLYEMISGRKPGDKFLEYAQIAGFVFLLALLLFANGNDIVKLFS